MIICSLFSIFSTTKIFTASSFLLSTLFPRTYPLSSPIRLKEGCFSRVYAISCSFLAASARIFGPTLFFEAPESFLAVLLSTKESEFCYPSSPSNLKYIYVSSKPFSWSVPSPVSIGTFLEAVLRLFSCPPLI